MICRKNEQGIREIEKLRDGNGMVQFRDMFTAQEFGDRVTVCAATTLQPGCSIGVHPHTENGELYCVLEGQAVVTEDGKEYVLEVGDAEFCADGHTHGIENRTEKPLVFLALIVPNR